jgi:tetratricopeptide (TPR) repeat protein
MTRTDALWLLWIGLILLLGPAASLEGQSDAVLDPGKAAQAKSQEEFDKYLEIVVAADPHQVIGKVDAFVSEFSQSELRSAAYQYKMHACEKLNDFDGMLAAGRKALLGNPDNVNILLALAPAMASRAAGRADRDQLLSQAEADAHLALEKLEATRLSRKVSVEEWTAQKHQMQSEAHGALGLVALQKKENQAAVREFSAAISLDPRPQGIQYLRLGMAFNALAASDDAAKNFRRAAELGPEPVQNLALKELKSLSDKNVPR